MENASRKSQPQRSCNAERWKLFGIATLSRRLISVWRSRKFIPDKKCDNGERKSDQQIKRFLRNCRKKILPLRNMLGYAHVAEGSFSRKNASLHIALLVLVHRKSGAYAEKTSRKHWKYAERNKKRSWFLSNCCHQVDYRTDKKIFEAFIAPYLPPYAPVASPVRSKTPKVSADV